MYGVEQALRACSTPYTPVFARQSRASTRRERAKPLSIRHTLKDNEHIQQRRQAMQQDTGPQIDQGAAAAMKDSGFARSPAWERVARTFLNGNTTCAACNRDNTQAKLEVHHMLPFHLCRLSQRPDLEFNPANLMTLCDIHHLYIGHLGDWQSFNETVRLDAKDV